MWKQTRIDTHNSVPKCLWPWLQFIISIFYDHFPLSYQPLSKWIIAKLANNIPEWKHIQNNNNACYYSITCVYKLVLQTCVKYVSAVTLIEWYFQCRHIILAFDRSLLAFLMAFWQNTDTLNYFHKTFLKQDMSYSTTASFRCA